MASPIYGTGASNIVNALAGQAQGQAESERLRRIREQQDFRNVQNQLKFRTGLEQQDLTRQQNFDFRNFTAENQIANQANLNAFKLAENQYNREQGDLRGEEFAIQQNFKRELEEGRNRRAGLSAAARLKAAELKAGQQKPFKGKELQTLVDNQRIAANPNATTEQRVRSQAIIEAMGRPAAGVPDVPVQAQDLGAFGRLGEGVKAFAQGATLGNFSEIGGSDNLTDSPLRNLRQAITGIDPVAVHREHNKLLLAIQKYEAAREDKNRGLNAFEVAEYQKILDRMEEVKKILKSLE